MAPLFSIENEYELLALHSVLFHARFSADTPTETAGTLLTAAMSQRVAAALQQHAVAASSDAWAGWLQAEGHPKELEFVRLRLAECRGWSAWSQTERLDHLNALLSPLRATESTISLWRRLPPAHRRLTR